MIEKGVDQAYASKLVQYGWETITEALKHGGITNMMDRLSNPAKIRALELSEQIKAIPIPRRMPGSCEVGAARQSYICRLSRIAPRLAPMPGAE